MVAAGPYPCVYRPNGETCPPACLSHRMVINHQVDPGTRRQGIVAGLRLGIQHADHAEVSDVHGILYGGEIYFEHPGHDPVLAPADLSGKGNDGIPVQLHGEQVPQGHGRSKAVGIGMIVNNDEDTALPARPIEKGVGKVLVSGRGPQRFFPLHHQGEKYSCHIATKTSWKWAL